MEQKKEIDIAFSTINNLMPMSSCAFTSIPKWYYDPMVVKKLIQLHCRTSIPTTSAYINYNSIAGVLPLLFYSISDEAGLKELLNHLSFEEQLYLFCPFFFPEIDLAKRIELKEIAKEGLTYIFNSNPAMTDWDKPNTFLLINDLNYLSFSGIASMVKLANMVPIVANGYRAYKDDNIDFDNRGFDEQYFWDTVNFLHKNIDKIIVIKTKKGRSSYYYSPDEDKEIQLFEMRGGSKTMVPYFTKYKWEIKNDLMRQLKEFLTEPTLSVKLNIEESKIKVYVCGGFYRMVSKLSSNLKQFSDSVIEYFNSIGQPLTGRARYLQYSEHSLADFTILLETKPIKEVKVIDINYGKISVGVEE